MTQDYQYIKDLYTFISFLETNSTIDPKVQKNATKIMRYAFIAGYMACAARREAITIEELENIKKAVEMQVI